MPANKATEAMLHAEDGAATDPARDQSRPLQSFTVRNLSVLAYANGFTLWHYKCDDTPISEVVRVGFFREACDMMAVGDMIVVTGRPGGTVRIVWRVSPEHVNTDTTR